VVTATVFRKGLKPRLKEKASRPCGDSDRLQERIEASA